MPGRTLKANTEYIQADVSSSIPRIFDQVQLSTANHQKNFVALHKLQLEAAQFTESVRNGKGVKLVGERIFQDNFFAMLMRVLPTKKGVTQADRILKFVGGYIKFINEKAVEKGNAQEEEDDEDQETMASRFTASLLRFLLKGFLAKDKSVRFRVLQTATEMVSHLGEIDEGIYKSLCAALLGRVHDKETSVRIQAAIALSKLAGSEDPSELEEGEQTATEVLIDSLAHDSSPEVRKAILLNIPVIPITLPHIIDRTCDTDPVIRKMVYGAVLEPNTFQGETKLIGVTHPRALSIAQREFIVRSGLGDRESSVKTAAASLIGTWVDIVTDMEKTEDDDAKAQERIKRGVVTLLGLFDLAEGTVATDALLSVFATRVEIFDNIEFGDNYWTSLTPVTAFLARVFVDHCKATKDEVRLEAVLPVVTAFAFRIQEAYNNLIEDLRAEEEERLLRDIDEEERIRKEDERMDKEFVISEMLKLAVNLDYSDEIGRRKMFQLVRDMLSQEQLPESLLARCLDVLRELSANERDLIRVVVEIVQDLRDPGDDEEADTTKEVDVETNFGDTPAIVKPPRAELFNRPEAELSPEQKTHADAIDLRCLSLCVGMLERVNGTLEENSSLDGVLRELIIPSVKRNEMAFREKGLVCLGLCCLIARRLALQSFSLFWGQIPSSPEILKITILQVVFDILMVHQHDILGQEDNSQRIVNYFMKLLGTETSEKIVALLCSGISKLVLSGMITDMEVVKNLISAYFSSATVDNQEARQCLAFFFPVYCYSSATNQRSMREIFIEMFEVLNDERQKLEDGQHMVSAAQVCALFVDWTDPLKLSKAIYARGKGETRNQPDEEIQIEMASDICRALLKKDYDKEDKKTLCQLLGKLHVPDTVDDDKIRTLKLLMHNLHLRRPLRDTATNNAFTKFEAAITKKFEKQLEDFNEEEYRKLEELQELFKFLDDIIPADDGELNDVDAPKKKGRKRRSESVVSASTETDTQSTSARREKSNTKNNKKRRFSTSDDDSDDVTEQGTPPPSAVPTRTMPRRSAAVAKKPIQLIEISSDSDEEATPVPRKSRSKSNAAHYRAIKEEPTEVDANRTLNENTSTEIPFDSIMDDSEEEEEEVNDLLAED